MPTVNQHVPSSRVNTPSSAPLTPRILLSLMYVAFDQLPDRREGHLHVYLRCVLPPKIGVLVPRRAVQGVSTELRGEDRDCHPSLRLHGLRWVTPPHVAKEKGRLMWTDTFISKTTRLYRDSRTLTQGAGPAAGPSSQLDQLNENLQDVTRIMTKNMEDLLWRGDSLDRGSLISPSHPSDRE